MSGEIIKFVYAEGLLDAAVACRLLSSCGMRYDPEGVRLANGNDDFWRNLPKYNKVARYSGAVYAQGDTERRGCVGPLLVKRKLARRDPNLVLRLAVPMVESWFLADAAGLAEWLGVGEKKIPQQPDQLLHPKRTLVNIARKSQKQPGLAPKPGTSAPVGPEYTQALSEFASNTWDPEQARQHSPSLDRAIIAIKRFQQRRG